MERTIARAHPTHYEIYETAAEWRDWLVRQHHVIAKKCDGHTPAETASASMDLVQAHKLFPAIPFLVTMSYCQEMARVVQSNDWIVFDIITESCLTPQYLQAWFEANIFDWSWSPRLVGSFLVPLYPGVTECLIFRKSP